MITGITASQRNNRDFIRKWSRLLYRGNQWMTRSELPARRLEIIRFRASFGAIHEDRYIPYSQEITGATMEPNLHPPEPDDSHERAREQATDELEANIGNLLWVQQNVLTSEPAMDAWIDERAALYQRVMARVDREIEELNREH